MVVVLQTTEAHMCLSECVPVVQLIGDVRHFGSQTLGRLRRPRPRRDGGTLKLL